MAYSHYCKSPIHSTSLRASWFNSYSKRWQSYSLTWLCSLPSLFWWSHCERRTWESSLPDRRGVAPWPAHCIPLFEHMSRACLVSSGNRSYRWRHTQGGRWPAGECLYNIHISGVCVSTHSYNTTKTGWGLTCSSLCNNYLSMHISQKHRDAKVTCRVTGLYGVSTSVSALDGGQSSVLSRQRLRHRGSVWSGWSLWPHQLFFITHQS